MSRKLPERWYRDLWLLAITVIVLLSLNAQGDQNADTKRVATQTRQVTKQTAKLTTLIQEQRADSIRASCEDQNGRHRRTVRALDQIIDQQPAGPNKDRAKAQRPYTVLLINALAPVRPCGALVRQFAGDEKPVGED